tara:strand:- start:12383 stop:13009 length:627 start_codon:yes stop_codon:yes gene_type:complete
MLKEKKCKAIGKAIGFESCGELVPVEMYGKANRVYGIGKSCGCYSKWLTSTPQGKEIIKKATLKATKTSREFKQFEKQEKDRTSLSWLLKNTVIACHKYIRKRDEGKPCISCQESYNSRHQAGHFYKAELFSTLKFNEFNINNQCVGCNIRKDGNESEYRVHLPKRIGEEAYSELNELAKIDKKVDHKWDREELKAKRKYYLNKIKEL